MVICQNRKNDMEKGQEPVGDVEHIEQLFVGMVLISVDDVSVRSLKI